MPTDKPNILLITADQQRFDTAGSAAPRWMRTPHYDHLCREGVTFSRAYSDCPICVPARVGIMTGKSVFTHGMSGNGGTTGVIDRNRSLPSLLRAAGYQTAAIGKMHFTPERARHGFDEMIIPTDYYRHMQRTAGDLQPMRHGLGQNELYPTMATVPESMTLTNWIAEQCMEYVRFRRDPTQPFFLWCSFSKPHPPFDPPEPYYSMYRDADIPEPIASDWCGDEAAPAPFVRHRQAWSCDLVPPEVIRAARAAYYGLITQIDYNIGRVFAGLQDLRIFNDTLILYTSDHGEFLGDHRTGGKAFFHESAAHVPFALRLPQGWSDRCYGTVCETPVTYCDIMPTFLAAAGAAGAYDGEGIDLTALARGQAAPRQYVEGCGHGMEWAGITDGRWKYMWYPEGAVEQLFDVQTDPHEEHELSRRSEHAGKLAELREELTGRQAARGTDWVKAGRLISKPLLGDSERDRRNRPWPGYHTEHCEIDVRH